MSSSQDSEKKRGAIEKAREGARLLSAGDYEGAIATCTDAIRLDPRLDGAYVLRSEAYRLSDGPSPLPFIFSPLVFVRDILVFIPRYLWWGVFHANDAMDEAYGRKELPPPRFREHDQSKLAREYLNALIAPSVTEMAEAQCAALRSFGTDTRALEPGPGPEVEYEGKVEDEDLWGWIEIYEGPVRWIGLPPTDDPPNPSIFLIPDSRIKSLYPRVSLYTSLGRWYVDEYPSPLFRVGWFPVPLDNELSLRTADRLNQDTALTELIILNDVGFGLETDLVKGCWMLMAHTQVEFTRPIWDRCQAIAEALLSMPLPTEE